MAIKANSIAKVMQVELSINDDSLKVLDMFLKSKGFKFNREIGKRECVYVDTQGVSHMLYWSRRATFNRTIVNTFEGDIFPYEMEIREIAYPAEVEHYYVVEGNDQDFEKVIKTLFNHKFEITGLTENVSSNGRLVFKRKNSKAQLNLERGRFRMFLNNVENMSRSLLSCFQII